MAHLIDKDALVAEIERQISAIDNCPKITNTQISVLEGDKVVLTKLLSFIDTLEVKEVDLDFQRFAKEMDAVFALPSSETKNTEEEPLNWEYAIAKHFYELGMQVSNKAQKGE